MTQTVEQAVKEAKLYTDNKAYVLLCFHPHAITVAASVIAELSEPFSALIVDKDEVTLVIPADSVGAFASRLRDYRVSDSQFSLITFDVALDPNLTGFMARISQKLAEANVIIMPFAAYTRDHILVPVEHFEKAWAALTKLVSGK